MLKSWKVWAAVAVGAIAVFWLIAAIIGPAPPKSVRIAGGAPGGAYAQAAESLAAALEAVNVRVEVIETNGSDENLARLQATDAQAVDIALVQSGLAARKGAQGVDSLGALFVEPAWMFARRSGAGPDMQGFRGMTVAAGPPGSGARALADLLMEDNGLGVDAITLQPLGGQAALAALRAGEVDAAFVVASPRAAWVRDLAAMPDLTLVPFDRAPAYERRYPFLNAQVLRRGVLDPAADLPAQDVPLLAATAQLAVRADLHPAIQAVLLEAAAANFSGGDALTPPGAYPNPHAVDLPVSEEATRFYRNGPTMLRRYLPFWAANLIERAWMVLLPALVLISPLIRSAPPVYRWRTRRKIYSWYRHLRALEMRGRAAKTADDRAKVRADLEKLQADAARIEVPEAYTDELYRLREHIDFVDGLVEGRLNAQGGATAV